MQVTSTNFLWDEVNFGPEGKTLHYQLAADLGVWAHGVDPIREVLLTGGIGWGKSYLMGWMVRYLCRCWSDQPNLKDAFSGDTSKPLAIIWEDRSGQIPSEMVKWFQKGLFWEGNLTEVGGGSADRETLEFRNGLHLVAISDAKDVEDYRVMAYFDNTDIHFRDRDKPALKLARVQKLLQDLRQVVVSSFWRKELKQLGTLAVASSRRRADDFLVRRGELAALGASHILYRSYASWDTKPTEAFCGETFYVCVGKDGGISIDFSDLWTQSGREGNWERIIEVPVEYREHFLRSSTQEVRDALRDYAGVVVDQIFEAR